ncbi:WD repeat protein [Arthroderma uncinatum]|uniref:WD repeat protein n=1 Tax=Arthroderma uncinatum TaxID=74035 RepID=UPI00144A5063|nr:WD repeat protein [Arthroderma uncinatum]KAF3482299.1 WD repeat protein [Arthroderma uncinatum]
MDINVSLAWNLKITFPFGLLIGLVLVTTAQLFRLLGANQLHRILRGHGLLRSRSIDDDDGFGVNYLHGTNRHPLPIHQRPNLYPKPPSQAGRELMASGDYGNNTYYADKLRSRKKELSAKLMYRELGAGPRGAESRYSRAISQDLLPGTPVDTIIHYDLPCYSGQFSDDGNFFFTSCQDFKVRMYDTSNPYIWRHYKTVTYPHGQWTITDATLSPDNRFLAYSSIRHVVCLAGTDPSSDTNPILLDLDNGRRHGPLTSRFGIWSVRFSGDGRELVAGTSSSAVVVYDIETRKNILQLQRHTDDVNAVCYGDSMSPHILYSGSDDTNIRVWDRRSMADGRAAGVFIGHTEGVTFVDSKGDGRYVLSNSKDQTMKLWDLRKMATDRNSIENRRNIYSTGFDYRFSPFRKDEYTPHPDDCSVVTFHGHGVLRTLIRCHFSPAGSTNSRYVYTGSQDGKVYIYNLDATLAKVIDVRAATRHTWDGKEGTRIGTDQPVKACVRDASWHPDAPIIAATSWNGWGREEGTCSVHSWGLSEGNGTHLDSELQRPDTPSDGGYEDMIEEDLRIAEEIRMAEE